MGLFGYPDRWEGIVACPMTPFHRDGSVDYATYQTQVRFLCDAGADAICALMHAAESLNLSAEESDRIVLLTIEAVEGRVPVMVHVSSASTAEAAARGARAAAAGAQAVVCLTPYHWRPDEEGLIQHFAAVSEASSVPLLIYSYPGATGVAISAELTDQLLDRIPAFMGLKYAGNSISDTLELAAVTTAKRPDFSLLSGTEFLLPNRVMGGAGAFSILMPVAPRLVRDLWRATLEGDQVVALALQRRAASLLSLLTRRYPANLKAAASLLGRPLGGPRLPNRPLSREETDRLLTGLRHAGLLESEPYGWTSPAGRQGTHPAYGDGGKLS